MILNYFRNISLLVVFASIIAIGITSCNKFEGNQTIPSYIQIDSISFVHNSIYPEGSLSAKISNVKVYVDNQLIGNFELPATIPVLQEGLCKIQINPGVILNGMISTRATYPFYEPIIIEDVNLVPGNEPTVLSNLTTEYRSSTKIIWEEDFEDLYFSIDTNSFSDVNWTLTETDSYETFYGAHSGKVALTTDLNDFVAITNTYYNLPQTSEPVFLEINYFGTNSFVTGVNVHGNGYNNEDVLVVNPKSTWNKLYIYLSPVVSYYPSADDYGIYFYTALNPGLSEGYFIIDNVRLIYQSNE